MRVIAGRSRGHKLKQIEGWDIRPTTDRVKEAVFSMLLPYLTEDARVLDLFGGTGALAIEALSRGAGHATIVDCRRESYAVISQNVTDTHFTQETTLALADALHFLQTTAETYSLIFLDPPYNQGLIAKALSAIADKNLLAPGGIIMVERDHTDPAPDIAGLTVTKERRYGRTFITLYQSSKGSCI